MKLLGPYRWVVSFSRFLGRLMICTASKGHFLTQIPQPMQRSSEIYAIFEEPLTSMQQQIFTTGRLHTLLPAASSGGTSAATMAMRSSLSPDESSPFFLGGIANPRPRYAVEVAGASRVVVRAVERD